VNVHLNDPFGLSAFLSIILRCQNVGHRPITVKLILSVSIVIGKIVDTVINTLLLSQHRSEPMLGSGLRAKHCSEAETHPCPSPIPVAPGENFLAFQSFLLNTSTDRKSPSGEKMNVKNREAASESGARCSSELEPSEKLQRNYFVFRPLRFGEPRILCRACGTKTVMSLL